MTIDVIKGKYPHVGWVDIEGDGILTEIAIMKNGVQGLMFIRLNNLDPIDKQRLLRIIGNRNAHLYELWDLMSNLTLGNGANALEYFHQYVKVLTPSGELINPTLGRIAAPDVTGLKKTAARLQAELEATQQVMAGNVPTTGNVAPSGVAQPKTGRPRGRPRKNPQ